MLLNGLEEAGYCSQVPLIRSGRMKCQTSIVSRIYTRADNVQSIINAPSDEFNWNMVVILT